MMEQLSLLDLLEGSTGDRIICPYCRSNWGASLKQWVLDRLRQEHTEAEPGRCTRMVELGVTEPFYTPDEKPWQEGCKLTQPRPAGFRGLKQLRSHHAAT